MQRLSEYFMKILNGFPITTTQSLRLRYMYRINVVCDFIIYTHAKFGRKRLLPPLAQDFVNKCLRFRLSEAINKKEHRSMCKQKRIDI